MRNQALKTGSGRSINSNSSNNIFKGNRLSIENILAQSFTNYLVSKLRCNPKPRPHTADAVSSNHITCFHILNKVQRSTELSVTLLTGFTAIIDLAQYPPSCFAITT